MESEDWAPTPAFERRVGKIEARTAVLEALQETTTADLHEMKNDMKDGFKAIEGKQDRNHALTVTTLVTVGVGVLSALVAWFAPHPPH